MVSHDIAVNGVQFSGATQMAPTVLQMNREDFPDAFLRDLGAIPPSNQPGAPAPPQISSAQAVSTSGAAPATLYQPTARVVHVALVQLNCQTAGSPRVDPTRVLSAGLVIRRVPRMYGQIQVGFSPGTAWPWMKNPAGQTGWVQPQAPAQNGSLALPPIWSPDDDPDPTKRPQLKSGRADLDTLLSNQSLSAALTESVTPAFAAAPVVCNAAQRSFVYALIPTASSEANTLQPLSVSPLQDSDLLPILTTFLTAGSHVVPQPDKDVTYKLMSDDYAKAQGKSDFTSFAATLRLLYSSFGAFDGSATAQPLLDQLNKYSVTVWDSSEYVNKPMGAFYQDAAAKLIAYDPNDPATPTVPCLRMPIAWGFFSGPDQTDLLAVMKPLLQARGQAAAPPQGRYQDSTRLYRMRMFFRIKGETPSCPPELVWSCYTDPFRFGAWYESAGRPTAPVPLPDPFDPNTLKNSKPSSSFAVPPKLMNAMQSASLTNLSAGTPPAGGGGLNLNWICGFSIPLITICAFFVLNIFLMLLNIVFFWLPFIKICIPFPIPAPSSGGQED
jgi:hypothetical protein